MSYRLWNHYEGIGTWNLELRLTSGSFQKEMALIPRKDRNQNTIGESEHDKFGEPEQIWIADSTENG